MVLYVYPIALFQFLSLTYACRPLQILVRHYVHFLCCYSFIYVAWVTGGFVLINMTSYCHGYDLSVKLVSKILIFAGVYSVPICRRRFLIYSSSKDVVMILNRSNNSVFLYLKIFWNRQVSDLIRASEIWMKPETLRYQVSSSKF